MCLRAYALSFMASVMRWASSSARKPSAPVTPGADLLLLDLLRLRESGDPIARQSEHGPFLHRLCPERAIKLDRRFIPIEHSPFHPAAAALQRNLGKIDKQCAAITFSASLWLDEQVFEIKARSPEPRGKVVKENCEANRRFSLKRKKNFRSWSFPK